MTCEYSAEEMDAGGEDYCAEHGQGADCAYFDVPLYPNQ
jgi:hypothetical protein